jgi:hypothetical protein
MNSFRQDWLSNVKNDLLAGLVVALALVPEAIAFSIIAGVDPKVGLYTAFCIATVSAFVGRRPGMISAATGAMALLMVPLVKDHGLQYLLAGSRLFKGLPVHVLMSGKSTADAVKQFDWAQGVLAGCLAARHQNCCDRPNCQLYCCAEQKG